MSEKNLPELQREKAWISELKEITKPLGEALVAATEQTAAMQTVFDDERIRATTRAALSPAFNAVNRSRRQTVESLADYILALTVKLGQLDDEVKKLRSDR